MQNKLHVIINSPNSTSYIIIPVVNDQYIGVVSGKEDYLFSVKEKIESIHFRVSKIPIEGLGYGRSTCLDNAITENIVPNLSTNEGMEVTINIIDSLFRYRVFKDTELKIGHKRLLFKDEGKKYKLRLRSLR